MVVLQVRELRFGALLESFVVSELMKLASWSERRVSFSHYRIKDQDEVDVVIEDRRGRIIGIEVTASATVRASVSMKSIQPQRFLPAHDNFRIVHVSRTRFTLTLLISIDLTAIGYCKHMVRLSRSPRTALAALQFPTGLHLGHD